MLNLGSIFIDTIKIISMNYAKIIYVPIFIVFWNGNTVFTISTALYHFNLLSSIYCIVLAGSHCNYFNYNKPGIF